MTSVVIPRGSPYCRVRRQKPTAALSIIISSEQKQKYRNLNFKTHHKRDSKDGTKTHWVWGKKPYFAKWYLVENG
jgi:hypothetical protein